MKFRAMELELQGRAIPGETEISFLFFKALRLLLKYFFITVT